MAGNDEPVVDRSPDSGTISELPSKPYAITVEFPVFLVMMNLSLSGVALGNIFLYRTCVHSLGHSVEECKGFLSPDRTNDTNRLETEVQKYATYVSTVRTVMESIGPAVLSCFLGTWSDTHGRKPIIVWPLFGMTLSSMAIVVYCMLDNLGPWWFTLTVIPFSMTGGYIVMFTAAFCYVSDVTSTENISFRMMVFTAAIGFGSVVGSTTAAPLLRAVGNIYLLLIVAVLFVVAYAFTNVCLDESLPGAVPGGISSVFDISLIKEMLRECFRERPNRGRAQILLLVAATSVSVFISYGISGLEYLYARKQLHWAMSEYTIYSAVNTTISFFGSFLGVVLFQKRLGVSDSALSILAFLSTTAEYVIKSIAVTSWVMYLGAVISVFKGLSFPLIRSLVTKMLPVEDIAKVFSLMCALEGICPLLSPTVFNSLYAATISSLPGAIYVFSYVLTGACTVMLGFVQYYVWKASSHAYRQLDSEDTRQ